MINPSNLDSQIEDKRQKMIDSGIENGYLDYRTIRLSKELDDLLNLKTGGEIAWQTLE